jgi:hypothetical protein
MATSLPDGKVLIAGGAGEVAALPYNADVDNAGDIRVGVWSPTC